MSAGFISPELAVVAPVALPGALAVAGEVLDLLRNRQRVRRAGVIALAAHVAGIPPEVLAERLTSSPETEELFLRTLAACDTAASQERLIAYAMTLERAVHDVDDLESVRWEDAFVRALDDLDEAAVLLLHRMGERGWTRPTMSGDVPANVRMSLKTIADGIPNLVGSVAALERNGLIADTVSRLVGGSGNQLCLAVTTFGRDVVTRLDVIAGQMGTAP